MLTFLKWAKKAYGIQYDPMESSAQWPVWGQVVQGGCVDKFYY